MESKPSPLQSLQVQVTVSGPQALDADPVCPHCLKPLERHQPDVERAETTLGTCLECGDWFVMVSDPEQNRVWITHLPLNHLRTPDSDPPGPSSAGEGMTRPKKTVKRGGRTPHSEFRAR